MKHNSTVKERSLHPTTSGHSQLTASESAPVPAELDERILASLDAASEKKALDLAVLDLREVASFTDFFVISSGANERQVQAISDAVLEALKKNGTSAARVEGYKTAEWILLDYGDFVFHVFNQEARKFYDLERLWREAKRVALPQQIAGEVDRANGSLRTES